jgi:flagellar biosynthesis/type III secretory pathway chaperone
MAVTSQPHWSVTLVDILDEQHDLYQQLHALSAEQRGLVASGEAEPLLSLLARRQSLIDTLAHVAQRLEPYKQEWAECWSRLDEPSRRHVSERISQVQHLLDEIIQQDEQDRASLSAHRSRMGEQLQQVNRGRTVNRAYGRAPAQAVASRFTDRQG